MVTFLGEIWVPEPLHLSFFLELYLPTAWLSHLAAVTFLIFECKIELNQMQDKEQQSGGKNFNHVDNFLQNVA